MSEILNGNSTAHGDIKVGVFKDGIFIPYGSNERIEATLDKDSSEEAWNHASNGSVIHGSFKENNFRPADKSQRPGFISKLTTLHASMASISGAGVEPQLGSLAIVDTYKSVKSKNLPFS
jgi:hypothetical protein